MVFDTSRRIRRSQTKGGTGPSGLGLELSESLANPDITQAMSVAEAALEATSPEARRERERAAQSESQWRRREQRGCTCW